MNLTVRNYEELQGGKILEFGTAPLSLAPNYSAQYFEREREKLFR